METVCQGDFNLYHCNWTHSNIPRSNQTYKLRSLISVLFNRIFPHGVSQLVSGPTRYFPGQTPSGLDHCFTNAPEKMSHIQKFHCGGSDHMLILAVRTSKSLKSTSSYTRKRIYKKFNEDDFIKEIRKEGFMDVYMSDDVNRALSYLTLKLSNILNRMAPLKSIQKRENL